MTVKQLIAKLKKYRSDTEVLVYDDSLLRTPGPKLEIIKVYRKPSQRAVTM